MSTSKARKIRHVYGLFDELGVIRYVGSSVNPQSRLVQHWNAPNPDTRCTPSPCEAWMRNRKKAGLGMPRLCILHSQVATRDEIVSVERQFIDDLASFGAPLLNGIANPAGRKSGYALVPGGFNWIRLRGSYGTWAA